MLNTTGAYIWRIGHDVDAGVYPNWESVIDKVNDTLSQDGVLPKGESAYRKRYQTAKSAFENMFSDGSVAADAEELYGLKQQLYDQRRELRASLRREAREDHLAQEVARIARLMNKEHSLVCTGIRPTKENSGSCEAVLALADWHYGMEAHNIWNDYDVDICKERIKIIVEETIGLLNTMKPRRLNIVLLGDAAHGAIHTTARVASNEDTCDQLMHVAEIMAEVVNTLSEYCPETRVYSTYGNHLRTVQNKKESLHHDNMEKVIPWWMKTRLEDNERVAFIDTKTNEFIQFDCCGYGLCAIHGDLDSLSTVGVTANTLFTKKFGKSIDVAICADKHHAEELERLGISAVTVRALCGTDDYANDHRLYSIPGQTLMFFGRGFDRITCLLGCES